MSHHYIDLLPNEIPVIQDLMRKFFVESKFEEAAAHTNRFLAFAITSKFSDPFNKVVAVFKDKPEYPLIDPLEVIDINNLENITVKTNNIPIAYVWFKTSQHEGLPSRITEINHIYIEPEYRNGTIIKKLIDRVIIQCARTGTDIAGVNARTVESKELWMKLGFKIEAVRLIFKDGVDNFV